MNRRRLLRAWVLVWLMLVWILLWGNFSWANVLSGFAVAVLITSLLPLPAVAVEGLLHPLPLVRFVAVLAWYLVESSAQVAWLALRPGPPPLSAVLRAQLSVKSDLVLTLLVNAITLTPGSMVLEIDRDRRLIYVHVLDVGSQRAVDRFYRQETRMERLLIAAFERDTDWRPAGGEHAR
jgi:multicomponent Na+:H+ antiporter subunit E